MEINKTTKLDIALDIMSDRQVNEYIQTVAEKEEKNKDESYIVSKNMRQHGGSFVHHIGCALQIADKENKETIKKAFPQYWKHYLNW